MLLLEFTLVRRPAGCCKHRYPLRRTLPPPKQFDGGTSHLWVPAPEFFRVPICWKSKHQPSTNHSKSTNILIRNIYSNISSMIPSIFPMSTFFSLYFPASNSNSNMICSTPRGSRMVLVKLLALLFSQLFGIVYAAQQFQNLRDPREMWNYGTCG